MLTFEQKMRVFERFPELVKTPRSGGRFNYIYPGSRRRGKVVVTELHPSGNGYVCARYIDKGQWSVDERGWVNIKDFGEDELVEMVERSIRSMAR